MRIYCIVALIMLPFSAQAFDFSKLQDMAADPEKMQQEAERMAKEMQAAAECMDETSIKKLEQEGRAIQERVKSLCNSGDRAGAQQAAVSYSRKLISSSEYRQLQQCSQKMLSILPEGFMEEIQGQASTANQSAGEVKHVCDI